jgi:cation transport ATPase
LGCGADVTRDAADVCLMGNDLRRIQWSMELAQRTRRVVHQNLVWAFAYNSIGVALAATGWLNPIWAALAMLGSSLLVISNSLRLAGSAPASMGGGQTSPQVAPLDAARPAEPLTAVAG